MNLAVNLRLAWRAAAGQGGARVSLFVRVLGVAFATLVLLLAVGADNALDSRSDRISWRSQWPASSEIFEDGRPDAWLQVNWLEDYYLEHQISRVWLAQLAPEAEVPPGLPRIPAPGEVFVSPALAGLIEADPAVLESRYGDTIAGTIGRDGLADAGELVAITGYAPEAMAGHGVPYRELPGGFYHAGTTALLRVVLIVGIAVLLFPIAMFIAAAARLNAQESDTRLAALRLAGADPGRVRWLVAMESMFSALPGVLLGLVLFFAVRPFGAQVEVDGARFYATDFRLTELSVLAMLLIPTVVVGASFLGLKNVDISPLGVMRQASERKVSPVGFFLLLVGFAALWYTLRVETEALLQTIGLVGSIGLIMLGVALVGTWAGRLLATLLVTRVRSAAGLLAFRRIIADPHTSFRTISGVTFAVFGGTLFLSLAAALEREVTIDNLMTGFRPEVIWTHYSERESGMPEGLPEGATAVAIGEWSGLLDTNEAIDEDEMYLPVELGGQYISVQQADCDLLARVLYMEGNCSGQIAVREGSGLAAGDSFVLEWMEPEVRIHIPADFHTFTATDFSGRVPDVVLPPATMEGIVYIGSNTIAVAPPAGVTQGTREYEQLRTSLIRTYPTGFIYEARQYDQNLMGPIATLKSLVYTGTFAAFALSGGTAAMVTAGGILARRRAFSLLRMSGCSLGVLRRTVMTESTLPLLLVSVISAGTAVAVSAMMIWRVGEGSVLPPPEFALPLLGGLVLGLALPLMTLPLLSSVTRTEQTRFD